MTSANIILTTRCLNRCPYCFSGRTRAGGDGAELRREELDRYLELLAEARSPGVSFLGGEPFLHPAVEEFSQAVLSDSRFERLTFFTTGFIPPHRFEWLEDEKVYLVVNANEPRDYSGGRYDELRKGLLRLAERPVDITPGFNIYREDFDYRPVLKLACDLGSEEIRWAVAVPAPDHSTASLDRGGKKRAAPRILEFLEACVQAGIRPLMDCILEPCVFSASDTARLAEVCPEVFPRLGRCEPVLDLGPGFRVTRCFGAEDLKARDVRDFESLEAIESFYRRSLDAYRAYAVDEECRSCVHWSRGHCLGGCVSAHSGLLRILVEKAERLPAILAQCGDLYEDGRIDEVLAVLAAALKDGPLPELLGEYANALLLDGRVEEFVATLDEHRLELALSDIESADILWARYGELTGDLEFALGRLRRCLRRALPERRTALQSLIEKLRGKIGGE